MQNHPFMDNNVELETFRFRAHSEVFINHHLSGGCSLLIIQRYGNRYDILNQFPQTRSQP